ncbi:MAG: ribonuclease H [Thermodesulfobacteriota bacterium]|jgi:ribonuclease HI|nr:MAG: ribonuclease H [Thermodesulfobacteriota bacterium]
MSRIALFTDVSINTNLKIGFGAYLIIPESYLKEKLYDLNKKEVKLKKFESTSSTKLEIETLLWSLEELEKSHKEIALYGNVTIYTDSQCIAGLSGRRTKLERSEFKSSKTNKELNNALLYRRFYRFSDRLKFEIIKLKGHSTSIIKDKIHKMFSTVDKGSRKALRAYLDKNKLHNKSVA